MQHTPMTILYKAKFKGQGFSIPPDTIVDIVAERKQDKIPSVMIAKNNHLIGVFAIFMIEKLKEEE